MNKEMYEQLSKEYSLKQFYQLRNHVGAYALSDDLYTRLIGTALYKALKRRGPWKSS